MLTLTLQADSMAEKPPPLPTPPPGAPPRARPPPRAATHLSEPSKPPESPPSELSPSEPSSPGGASAGDALPAERRLHRSGAQKHLPVEEPPPLDANAALDAIRERVDGAQERLAEMQHSCEVMAHMEHRTRMANHSLGGEIEGLRHAMATLRKDEEAIRELQEEASRARAAPEPRLSRARAHVCARACFPTPALLHEPAVRGEARQAAA